MGIKRGQTILDFGCGSGNYANPAALIVGRKGKVYALDKKRQGYWPSEGLYKLIWRAKLLRLENIVKMNTSGEPKIDLGDESVDVVCSMMSYITTIFQERKTGENCYKKFIES